VGTLRRELLDHAIVLNEHHLRRLLEQFIAYYNHDRTHLGLGKETPLGRPVERQPELTSNVVGLPRVGGLHRRYAWRRAAYTVSSPRFIRASPPSRQQRNASVSHRVAGTAHSCA
jgi:Integrase core domain